MTEPPPPEAVSDHFRSVDSTPAQYALARPPRVVNGFLVNFTTLSLLGLLVIAVFAHYAGDDTSRDLVVLPSAGERAAVPVRLFVTVFFVVFGCSIASDLRRRARVCGQLLGTFAVVILLVDVTAYLARDAGVQVPVVGQQIVSGMVAMISFPIVVLRNAHLPPPVELPMTGRIRWHAWPRIVVPLVLAFATAALVERYAGPLTRAMRDVALLGGIGPGVFLVQQVLALLTAGIGLVLLRRSSRRPYAPPVAVLVPAHNEAHLIAATIDAVDRAAAAYAGTVRLYVVDNASTDETIAVAETAIEHCPNLTGEVLVCITPGKAIALNYGLARITEPFVVRIDADTVVGEGCLARAMRHFADGGVGAVGGLPLPTTLDTFFDRARTVEVLVRHGFFQISLMGYDGILGIPGMFVAYRKAALDEVGPIVQGMNGEDTDICLRMGTAGYRCVSDPRAVYRSETPRTWAHMREQRTRWFRSIYHLSGHHRHAIFSSASMAGAVVLPLQLINAARRAMLVPMLIFAFLLLVVFHAVLPTLRWQPVVATIVGLPFLMAVLVCLLLGRPRAVLYVPEYLVFRLVRSYFTLAAVLSLIYPPVRPPLRSD
ncbi:glycosyltransferase [Nocardioides mangrovi]|uniref:Glycosyltransferase family 2 protein n=1 Tax=Nocardioides mangrovi TaxID=2874580 RepID=A0ABS7UA85_9ACTN|nr:glycosyltransferase family 2 protein [Nocardioides mangrovi]MBZ5737782.1 glycosyltransferase family 2 protein [Nocardioides mangrovi]